MARAKKSVTQSQIAEMAGVSQATVSAILSNSGVLNIGEETRLQVLKIAEKLGYVANRVPSRSKGRGGRRQVLFVEGTIDVEDDVPMNVSGKNESIMGQLVMGASRALLAQGYGLSVYQSGNNMGLMQWLMDEDFAGVIWHADEGNHALLHWVASHYPLVLLNRVWQSDVRFDSVGVHQELNVSIAADHLWSCGHRKIAIFGNCPTNSIFGRRIEEYRRFVRTKGIRDYTEFSEIRDDELRPAREKVNEILDIWQGLGAEAPTAMIMSDTFALYLIGCAKERGISVPEDLSLIGIDNSESCLWVKPALSSMNAPFERACDIAVEYLVKRMESAREPSRVTMLEPQLVLRDSVRILSGSESSAMNVGAQ